VGARFFTRNRRNHGKFLKQEGGVSAGQRALRAPPPEALMGDTSEAESQQPHLASLARQKSVRPLKAPRPGLGMRLAALARRLAERAAAAEAAAGAEGEEGSSESDGGAACEGGGAPRARTRASAAAASCETPSLYASPHYWDARYAAADGGGGDDDAAAAASDREEWCARCVTRLCGAARHATRALRDE
jgi:hypothetical protein